MCGREPSAPDQLITVAGTKSQIVTQRTDAANQSTAFSIVGFTLFIHKDDMIKMKSVFRAIVQNQVVMLRRKRLGRGEPLNKTLGR